MNSTPRARDLAAVLDIARASGDELLAWRALLALALLWAGRDYARVAYSCSKPSKSPNA